MNKQRRKGRYDFFQTTATKTFMNKEGSWIDNIKRSPILLCCCGSKYIKTRDNQTHCLLLCHEGYNKKSPANK